MNAIPQIKYFVKNGGTNDYKRRSQMLQFARHFLRIFKPSCSTEWYMHNNGLISYNRYLHALLTVAVAFSLSVSGCSTHSRSQRPSLAMAPISDDLRGDPTTTIEVKHGGASAWVLMAEQITIPAEEILRVKCSSPERLGEPFLVSIVFKQSASSKLKSFSDTNLRRRVAIFVENEVIATPLVTAVVTNELVLEFGLPESYKRAVDAIKQMRVPVNHRGPRVRASK